MAHLLLGFACIALMVFLVLLISGMAINDTIAIARRAFSAADAVHDDHRKSQDEPAVIKRTTLSKYSVTKEPTMNNNNNSATDTAVPFSTLVHLVKSVDTTPGAFRFLKAVNRNLFAELLIEDYGFNVQSLSDATGLDIIASAEILKLKPHHWREMRKLSIDDLLRLSAVTGISIETIEKHWKSAQVSLMLNDEHYLKDLTKYLAEHYTKVIYSPNESAIGSGRGFWSGNGEWVDLEEAARYTIPESATRELPSSTGGDAEFRDIASFT